MSTITAEIKTFAGWFNRKLIILTYSPIKPFIFEIEIFDSEDNILADSEISSLLTALSSVNLYILGIIFEKTNINTTKGSKNLIIVNGIFK